MSPETLKKIRTMQRFPLHSPVVIQAEGFERVGTVQGYSHNGPGELILDIRLVPLFPNESPTMQIHPENAVTRVIPAAELGIA